MKTRRTLAGFGALLALIALGVAGCGPRAATLSVEMKDFKYAPDHWSVPAGAQVTLKATNSGTQTHEWVIINKGDKAVTPWSDVDEKKIFWELDDVEAGNVKTATFTAPAEPGDYEIVCGQPAHIEQGMVGTLTVTP